MFKIAERKVNNRYFHTHVLKSIIHSTQEVKKWCPLILHSNSSLAPQTWKVEEFYNFVMHEIKQMTTPKTTTKNKSLTRRLEGNHR
jgi:hypothetical protein